MYAIKDILNSKYLVFKKCNSAFGELILLGCIRADFVGDTAFNLSYEALFKVNQNTQIKYKLVYNKGSDTWYLYPMDDNSNISYRLDLCTNDIVDILELHDIITYCENGIYYSYKVVGKYPQHKALFVEEMSTKKRFKIGTIFNRFNRKPIFSIKKQEKGAI